MEGRILQRGQATREEEAVLVRLEIARIHMRRVAALAVHVYREGKRIIHDTFVQIEVDRARIGAHLVSRNAEVGIYRTGGTIRLAGVEHIRTICCTCRIHRILDGEWVTC